MALISFNPYLMLLWILFIAFIPGALLALALLRKHELHLYEKILIGCAAGLMVPSLISFVLNLVGISYSFLIALVSVLAFYAMALYLFWKERAYELFSSFKPALSLNTIVPIILLFIMVSSFLMRISAYSPVFHELDPYFYVYPAQQLLTLGTTPFEDKTAWFPEALNDHRTAPMLSFMEANWYSFYTGGGEYSNYLLALVSDVYPPLFAAFIAFFVYLFVASHTRRSYGLVAAALVSFMPIFVIKLAAGEFEIQPYAFFALAMFFATYALTLKFKSKAFAMLAALAYVGLSLGSASEIVLMAALIIFVPLYSIMLFLKEKDTNELYSFLVLNAIIIGIGLMGSYVLKDYYVSNGFHLAAAQTYVSILVLGLPFVLYLIKQKVADREHAVYALAALIIVGFIALAFTPIGYAVRSIALSGLGIAEYTYPLQRTIAEQPPSSPSDYVSQLGILGDQVRLERSSPLAIVPGVINGMFGALISLVNALVGTSLEYNNTLHYYGRIVEGGAAQPTEFAFSHIFILAFILLFPIACILALRRHLRGETNLFLFFLAVIAPPVLVGILKAKFVIYMGFLLAIAYGFILGEFERVARFLLRKADLEHVVIDKHTVSVAFLAFIFLGGALSAAQLLDDRFPPRLGLLFNSMTPRYQDDPLAVQPKLSTLCSQIEAQGSDGSYICAAARDPIGFASQGINYQYNSDLCFLSVFDDPFAYLLKQNTGQPLTSDESVRATVASYRCQRVSDYWIDSMEWIRDNTEKDSRTTSWWDYGHWINFFGQRNTVLRNDHVSTNMIGRVAHAYLHGSLDDLKTTMRAYHSKYALFDIEIAGADIGGKYHALNYLGCAWANETDVSRNPGSSPCEAEHLWEHIYLPLSNTEQGTCVISEISNKTGTLAFYNLQQDGQGNTIGLNTPVYCTSETTLANGQNVLATYYLDRKHENGDLVLNKANLVRNNDIRDASGSPIVTSFTLFYTDEPVWVENGEVKSGYEDRKGKYYDSNLYRAFFLKDLPGFELVYESPQRSQFGGHVKIYKLVE